MLIINLQDSKSSLEVELKITIYPLITLFSSKTRNSYLTKKARLH